MKTWRKMREALGTLHEVKGVLEVYEELAAKRMQRIRDEIMKTRDYFKRLAELSKEVGLDLSRAGQKRGGEAVVLVAANKGLFGDIIEKVFVEFTHYIEMRPQAEIYVVGRVGEQMMKELGLKKRYTVVDLPEGEEEKGWQELAGYLQGYEKVRVFYGEFVSLANQRAVDRVFSGKFWQQVSQGLNPESLRYLYEPSVEKLAKRFEGEIFESVLGQTLKEADLAKYASRLMHLDGAIGRIEERSRRVKSEMRWWLKREENRKQNLRMVSFHAQGGGL